MVLDNQSPRKTPQLLAPAGDLATAITAFEAGADAVYLGLEDFSARKAAKNFTLDDLARLKTYTIQHHKAFYVALNTVIREEELPKLIQTLTELEPIGPDALIVQDVGVTALIGEHFSKIPFHASTQMGIHNSSGLCVAKEMGIKRVILARELAFETIKQLRQNHPDIELEVFIHGALCYSFSGLCLASGLMLNRSGNRGECAQICRGYFTKNTENQYCFSCNDLSLQTQILKLKDIGIDSLKIEGRLKTKEYVASTVKLYRYILDKNPADNDDYLARLNNTAKLTFSRKTTTGYFNNRHGKDLVDPYFPGHRGVYLGQVEKTFSSYIYITVKHELNQNDTLMLLRPGVFEKGIRFNAFDIKGADGKKCTKVKKGALSKIKVDFVCHSGDDIYLISSAAKAENPGIDCKSMLPKKIPLAAELAVDSTKLTISSSLFDHKEVNVSLKACPEEAKGPNPFKDVIKKLFGQSGNSRFVVTDIKITNHTCLKNVFVPVSTLKKFKNLFYTRVNETYALFQKERAKNILSTTSMPAPLLEELSQVKTRKLLSPIRPKQIPFADSNTLETPHPLSQLGKYRFVPLLPVIHGEQNYFNRLKKMIQKNPGIDFVIGLNNLHHLYHVKELEKLPNVFFYLDFYLYMANRFALEFWNKKLKKILFAYSWIEGDRSLYKNLKANSPIPLVFLEDTNTLPLFISMGCSVLHNQCKTCPKDCSEEHDYVIKNAKKTFAVIVKDCMTYVFQVNSSSSSSS